MNQTLNACRILVTRPAQQADKLCQLIAEQGGVAVRFPTIAIVGLEGSSDKLNNNEPAATNPLPQLSNCQWLIFISANAVNFALKAIDGKIGKLQTTKIAAIGQATARELKLSGLQVDLLPQTGFDSEAILAMPEMQQVNGQDILIVRGQGGREELANILRNRGAKVSYWEVYKRLMPQVDSSEVIELLENKQLHLIIITSFEALQNLIVMLGANNNKALVKVPLVVVSNRISQLAAELGFTRMAVADSPSDQAIIEAAIALVKEE